MIEFTPGQRRLMAGSGGAGEGPIITQIERVIVDPKVEDDAGKSSPMSRWTRRSASR